MVFSKIPSVFRQFCSIRRPGLVSQCLQNRRPVPVLWQQREHCNKPCGMKVTICGAAGQTGQPLALLLKQCPLLDEIALYDICPTCGYGMELSHVDTKCKVSSFSGRYMLCDALLGARVVVIVARDKCDTFEANAPIITEIALQICNTCPNAFVVVATEPVESLTPLVGEIQRLRGCYNPRALLGVVELNCSRANTVLADFLKVPPESIKVPVIGGATTKTMVPVLSAAVNPCIMTQEQVCEHRIKVECVTSSIMSGNDAVKAAKGNMNGTPSLAGAYAVARTTINVVKGLQGHTGVVQCAYVDSMGTCAPECQYFSNDVTMGGAGIAKCHGIPELTKFENCLLCNCLPSVRNEIARAIWLVYSMCTQCGNSHCTLHPNTCTDEPQPPCVPPQQWAAGCPDKCRDEYLASICRKTTLKIGPEELCWRPSQDDFNSARQNKIALQLPIRGNTCPIHTVPKSIRMAQILKQRTAEQRYKTECESKCGNPPPPLD